jgi:hypothetical protein
MKMKTSENNDPAAPRIPSSFPLFASVLLTVLLSACAGPRPIHGGKSLTTPAPAGGLAQTLTQGDNPARPTRQTQETIKVRTYTLPPVNPVNPVNPVPSVTFVPSVPNSHLLSPSFSLSEREESRATTELGAAQKDTARELTAKLASLKGIVWVGVALFIFGLASIFWPPLQTIIASVTTSIAITLGGLALMILPTLIVGNELLILGGVVLAVGAWCLAHRHGHLRGLLTATQDGSRNTRHASATTPVPK